MHTVCSHLLLSVVAPLLALCSCEWFVLLQCACACDLLTFLHRQVREAGLEPVTTDAGRMEAWKQSLRAHGLLREEVFSKITPSTRGVSISKQGFAPATPCAYTSILSLYLSISIYIYIGVNPSPSRDSRPPRHVYTYSLSVCLSTYLSLSISGLTHLKAGIRPRHPMCVHIYPILMPIYLGLRVGG